MTKLFFEARSDAAYSPDFAVVLYTEELAARVRELQAIFRERNLSEIREFRACGWYDVVKTNSEIRTELNELAVPSDGDFRFTAVYKHSDEVIYTETITLEQLEEAFKANPGAEHLFFGGSADEHEEWLEVYNATT